ncbi:MAG TPA: glycosyltransferase family 4 protein [Polyangiaceae bacterium LLY-WYZ-15_(1-7)]|nr:glycosyl transferase family 1 [Myxococcales bacterium]MAT24511.1 glycosyl transferase family 1 [Sandaracinus sp.]HJL01716.1 glycosyltransferase family 4 protein [Polyangiaceae bacterium LLY-WYZ-15_(1-7)]MBJ73513.1 glycosyl transferase family 1 [Sandaracinus sp.]HJL09886.1 glycosyltransferase family 4 protein [Polyangiaceae bacterium LLY-WYZ-15_(1-7)]
MAGKRIRALIIAEAANPEWVSVPLVGWSHARALGEQVDAHVVTQVRNREAIERFGWTEGQEFTSLDTEFVARGLWRLGEAIRGGKGKGWTTLQAVGLPSYYAFETLLAKEFGPRLRAGEFDVVHRVTPLSPTQPSLLSLPQLRGGTPFVIGPLNGGVPWPRQFDAARRAEREWLSYVRGAYRLLPFYRSTLARTDALIIGSQDTLAQVPAKYRDKCVYVPENAIAPERFPLERTIEVPEGPLRVAFVGRLVPYKGCDMLIEALAPAVKRGDVVIDVYGDGPEMGALRALRERLGVVDGVRLDGWVPHEELHTRLSEASLFVFPSIREFGGGVVLEAMACGLIPVVVEYGGPAELVTEDTGYLVPLGSREELVARFRAQVDAILAKPREELVSMAESGRRRVEQLFTWEAKARQTVAVYEWVLGRRGKPDFGVPLMRGPE